MIKMIGYRYKMIGEISSIGYACMLAKIFFTIGPSQMTFTRGLAPLGPGLATPQTVYLTIFIISWLHMHRVDPSE